MAEYFVPSGKAEAELIELRSQFIGNIFAVESEEEARACLDEIRKRHYDARHHCWCYRLRTSGVERYSDDGEPQGTAGQPMLNVFQREDVTNVLCVVTRYFGGILLGAGGLTRAYGCTAKDTLDAAGISVVRPWTQLEVNCPYPFFERMKQELSSVHGVEGEHDFGAEVCFRALLPEGAEDTFVQRLRDISSGQLAAQVTGEIWKAVPYIRQ